MWLTIILILQLGLAIYIVSSIYLVVVFLLKSITNSKEQQLPRNLTEEKHLAIVFTNYSSEKELIKQIQFLNRQKYQNFSAYFFVDHPMIMQNNMPNIQIIRPNISKQNSFGLMELVKKYYEIEPDAWLITKSSSTLDDNLLTTLNGHINQQKQVIQCKLVFGNEENNLSDYYNISNSLFDLFDRKAFQASGISSAIWDTGFLINNKLFQQLNFAGFQNNSKAFQTALLVKSIRVIFEPKAFIVESSPNEKQFVELKKNAFSDYLLNLKLGMQLFQDGIKKLKINYVIFGLNYLRPPAILLLILSIGFALFDLQYGARFSLLALIPLLGIIISGLLLIPLKSLSLLRPIGLSLIALSELGNHGIKKSYSNKKAEYQGITELEKT